MSGVAPLKKAPSGDTSLPKKNLTAPAPPKDPAAIERQESAWEDRRLSLIQSATAAGAPLFNKHDFEGCFKVYYNAIADITPLFFNNDPRYAIMRNTLAVVKYQDKSSACWTLRLSMDSIHQWSRGIARWPLHWACTEPHVNPALVNSILHAAITHAQQNSDPGKAQKKLVNVNQPTLDKDRSIPLHFAVKGGHFDIAKLLVKAGSDTNALDGANKSCMEYAMANNQRNMIALLLTSKNFAWPANLAIPQKLSIKDVPELKLFPSGIQLLSSRLRELDISKTNISKIPEFVSDLQALESADFSSIDLREFPVEVIACPNLKTLKLQNNKIGLIPPTISMMMSLEALNLSNNVLIYLPSELTKMPALKPNRLELQGNPLETIPKETVARGGAAILSYLSQLREGKEKWKRMKLLVIGEENVGKTSLISALTDFNKRKKEVREGVNHSTDGISIATWPISSDLEFSTWDFAGQEVFYPTHQFFLSNRSIYIIAFNSANLVMTRIRYWLQQISASVFAPVVFLVGTRKDQIPNEEGNPGFQDEWSYGTAGNSGFLQRISTQLRQKFFSSYRTIRACVFVSNNTGDSLNVLTDLLVEHTLKQPTIKNEVPTSYLMLDRLVAKQKIDSPIVSWKNYTRWVIDAGIELQNALNITEFLHDVGSLIYFNDEASGLNEIVILDPQWLAEVMATLVTFKANFVKHGILRKQDLPQIWKKYNPQLYQTLLNLLLKFGVAYPALGAIGVPPAGAVGGSLTFRPNANVANPNRNLDEAESFIVPSLLPEDRPVDDLTRAWPKFPSSEEFQFNRAYQFDFSFDFGKMLVRLLHFPDTVWLCSWRNGCVIQLPSRQQSVLVEWVPLTFRLNIHFRVSRVFFDHHNDLYLLRSSIEIVEYILDGFYSCMRNIEQLVPCSHCFSPANMLAGCYDFKLKDLISAVNEGKTFVYCRDVPTRPVNLRYLAPDLTFSDLPVIDSQMLVVEKELGQGGFGVVYKGWLGDKPVAIKQMKAGKQSEEGGLEDNDELQKFNNFKIEAFIMSKLDHPNLVKFYGIALSPLRMVIEFCPEKDLYHFLKVFVEQQASYARHEINTKGSSNRGTFNDPEQEEYMPSREALIYFASNTCLPWNFRLRLALDMAYGLEYMQSFTPPIAHRDLRSPNIFIMKGFTSGARYPFEEPIAKIADFGLSRQVSHSLNETLKTWQWMAPEVFDVKKSISYNELADIYSFGIVLWEIATMQPPFAEYHGLYKEIQMKQAISESELRPTFPDSQDIPPPFIDLVKRCWVTDANQRLPVKDAISILHHLLGHDMNQQAAVREAKRRSFQVSSMPMVSSRPAAPISSSGGSNEKSAILTAQMSSLGMLNAEFQIESCGDSERTQCLMIVGNSVWAGMSTGVVNVLDPNSRSILRTISAAKERIISMIHADEDHVWFTARNSIYSVNCNAVRPAKLLNKHNADIVSLVKIDPKNFASADASGLIYFWNHNGKKLASIKLEQPVLTMCVAFESLWVSTPRSIHVVDLQSRSIIQGVQLDSNQSKCMVAVDDELWVSQNDNTILVFKFSSGSLVLSATLMGHTGRVGVLCRVNDTVWSGSFDRTIIIWSASTKECLMELKGDGKKALLHNDTVHSIFIVGNTVWSASRDNKICIWRQDIARN